MACIYRRGSIWWWRCQRNGRDIRETTRHKNKDKALAFMARRLKEIDGDNLPVLPKILLLDIETSPLEVYVWGLLRNNYIPIDFIKKDWAILCYAAKWLFGDKIFGAKVTPREAVERRDDSIIKGLWDLFEKADIIIAHNGDNFDIRKSNTRFAKADLGPPSPFQSVDTKKAAQKTLNLPSYKLDYIARFYGLPVKIKTDFDWWKQCVDDELFTKTQRKKALKRMFDYNKQDINVLEEVYLKLRPWTRSHPNVSLYMDCEAFRCSNCGNENVKALNRPYVTPAGMYDAFRCMGCGAIGRSRYTNLTMSERKKTLLSTAR